MQDRPKAGRNVAIIAVTAMVVGAGIVGYLLGAELTTSGPDERSMATAHPSSQIIGSLVFDVYEEVNASTDAITQFIQVQGNVESKVPFEVSAQFRLRVTTYYLQNAIVEYRSFDYNMNTRHYDDRLNPLYYVMLLPMASEAVNWTILVGTALSLEHYPLIREENATFHYAFTGTYSDEGVTHPCSVATLSLEGSPQPVFRAEFALTVFDEWPSQVDRAVMFANCVIYNDGDVRGSCVLRWRFNNSLSWTDEYQEVDLESSSWTSIMRIYDGGPLLVVDDDDIRLDYWVTTLW